MGKPPNHPILIGFSIIFTIHFGGKKPYFLETSMYNNETNIAPENGWFEY